jgi:ligand-binding SRPBCC domain-containing protein
MPRIVVETLIQATPERCFDLARDVGVHEKTTGSTKERVVEIRKASGQVETTGLLELGDEVTFEAVHFGLRQRLTSKVVAFDRPHEFADEMQKGAFKSLRHIHRFEQTDSGTKMTDVFDFESPGWIFGSLANTLFVTRYMAAFLQARGEELKKLAEG